MGREIKGGKEKEKECEDRQKRHSVLDTVRSRLDLQHLSPFSSDIVAYGHALGLFTLHLSHNV